jgi:hypothetical protein
MLGTFVEKLSDLQKMINAIPDDASKVTLSLNDSTEYRQMKADWKVRVLCEKLAASSVRVVELAGNELTDDFAIKFAEIVLPQNESLREINFGRNAIGAPGILAIIAALPQSKLEVLKLNSQKKPAGAEAEGQLAAIAGECPSLVKVNLDWKSSTHRSNCERGLMQNADRARKRRQADKAAAAAAAADGAD